MVNALQMVNGLRWSPKASLRDGVHSSKASSASLWQKHESFQTQHHLTLEASWTQQMLRKDEAINILCSKEANEEHRHPYCSVCVCSGCQSQKRASRNPYRNNHHSVCCRAEEVQIPLSLHPEPLAEVWGRCNARNSQKRMSLSSCALASAQQRHCSSVRGTRAARRMRMSEESSSGVKLAV